MTSLRFHPLTDASARPAEAVALRAGDGPAWTFSALSAAVDALAQRWGAGGLQPGEAVAVWAENSSEWVIAALAVWRLDAVLLPLAPRWTAPEVDAVLGRVAVRWLLVDEVCQAKAGAVETPVCVRRLGAETPENTEAAREPTGFPPNCAALVPTSGTTGTPKLAMLSAEGLDFTAVLTAAVLSLGPEDVYWVPMPLHHVGGLGALWRTLRAGATVALARRGPAADWVEEWRSLGVTHVSLVPTQMGDVLEALGPDGWPSSLRVVLVGGAAPPPDLAEVCPGAWVTYGLTEAGGTVTLSPAADAQGTSGLALPGIELGVVVEKGGEPRPSGFGEVAVRGPTLMLGYWGAPEATAEVLPGEWLLTGDLGQLNETGRLTISARRSDLIVTGGENVYPAEVEAALLTHPAVLAAAVVPLPDARWGQVVTAALQIRPGERMPSMEDVRAWLHPRLAAYKHPKFLFSVGRFPRLSAGKIDRMGVRMMAQIAARQWEGV